MAAAQLEAFAPLQDYVLIKPLPKGRTPGGIAIPETAQEDLGVGLVVACGPGNISWDAKPPYERQPMDVAVGDEVYFAFEGPGVAQSVTLDGKEYALARNRHLVAKRSPESVQAASAAA